MKKTAKKRGLATSNSQSPSLSATATRRFALSSSIIREPLKIKESLRLNYLYQRSIRMSNGFVALPKSILQNPNLTPDSIILYCHLLHFDRNGSKQGCIARRETLSRFSNLSLHRIRKGISNLEDEGIISVVRRRNGLSDRIRINKECRPKINEPKQVRKPKKHLSTPQPPADPPGTNDLKPSNTREINNFNSSTIKNNKNTQVKEIYSIGTEKEDESALDKHLEPDTSKISPISGHQPRQTPPTKPQHLQTLTTIKTLKPLLRDNSYNHFISYNHFFSNIAVIDETNDTISLATPNDEIIANFIQEQYSSKLGKILGKDVKISSVLQNK